MESAIRSSTEKKLDIIADRLAALAELSGGFSEAGSRYSA